MTWEELRSYEIGTTIEAGRLMSAVTDEPVTHTVISSDDTKVCMVCHFFGIRVGSLTAKPGQGQLPEYTVVIK
jgi:hypothetical protein